MRPFEFLGVVSPRLALSSPSPTLKFPASYKHSGFPSCTSAFHTPWWCWFPYPAAPRQLEGGGGGGGAAALSKFIE
ncbi:hypothetical protein E2C01_092904 [Portunus trituberculatus]|uniref:Uncharacterized protein n=1 Tax=Portunus trituberculatus TaxID=210409 RepID=A0A5B7JZ59_PORTR|nr:hypothetical protein [Portunus trituberculatus]